ncbi:MAG: methylthioribulose 1-phosphate dehydratase [Polyangiaceae bacterium]|jgi:methylthioribulose-1-phosphate dehydratase
MQLSEAAEQIIDAGRWLDARGWAPATAGNYSVRLDSRHMAITVSGRHKGRLAAEDVMVVDCDGRPLDARRPSAETPLHAVMYRLDPSLAAVVHTHSVLSTVLGMGAERSGDLRLAGYEMLKALPGISTHDTSISVPIFDNTQDMLLLARSVEERWNKACPGYLIRGHGLYTWGATMAEALRSVEAFEFLFACEIEKRKLGS